MHVICDVSAIYLHCANNHDDGYQNGHAQIETDHNFDDPWWQPVEENGSIGEAQSEHQNNGHDGQQNCYNSSNY